LPVDLFASRSFCQSIFLPVDLFVIWCYRSRYLSCWYARAQCFSGTPYLTTKNTWPKLTRKFVDRKIEKN
jgi:hypothetical protein